MNYTLQLHFKKTQRGMMKKLKVTSGPPEFIYRHHFEPSVKLYMPKEETFPIPMKYIDVTRTTDTSLDVLSEKIEDYWNVDGDRDLSVAWTGFTRHQKDTHGPGGDLQGNKQPLVPTMWKHV